MLELDVWLEESYDETTEKFVKTTPIRVSLEHSLVTVSKWESVWEKPFLGKEERTDDETLSYIEMMIQTPNLPAGLFAKLLKQHNETIEKYIVAPMTATQLPEGKKDPHNREVITSELIYFWMISMNIPVQFERWHLNRLITLIRVINFKNTPQKKLSAAERRALNKTRQAKFNTRG